MVEMKVGKEGAGSFGAFDALPPEEEEPLFRRLMSEADLEAVAAMREELDQARQEVASTTEWRPIVVGLATFGRNRYPKENRAARRRAMNAFLALYNPAKERDLEPAELRASKPKPEQHAQAEGPMDSVDTGSDNLPRSK